MDDVIKLLDKLNCPSSDFRTMFCIVTLISLTLDLSEPTKDKVDRFVRRSALAACDH